MKNRIQFAAPLGLIALSLMTPPLLSRALGQSDAAATPAFDVASIKRSDPGNTRDNDGIRKISETSLYQMWTARCVASPASTPMALP